MRVYTLLKQQLIRKPRADVFRFFQSPENLELITPASIGLTILTPKPISMHPGAVLDYTIRLFGVTVRWTTLVSTYDPPARFSDVALKGPYRFWHHTHTFEETSDGTLMTDVVRYALPFGPLGRLTHCLLVKRQLKNIFDYRAAKVAQMLEPEKETSPRVVAARAGGKAQKR